MYYVLNYLVSSSFDWNAYFQLEEAFTDKLGYEGVQLIGVRYVN